MEESSNKEILADLKVLSLVKVNDKLKTKDRNLTIDEPASLLWFWRWWGDEGRKQNAEVVEKLMDRVKANMNFYLQLLKTQPDNEDCLHHLQRLAKELRGAGQGLLRLQYTYTRRVKMWARLQLVLEDIDRWCNRMCAVVGWAPPSPLVKAEPGAFAGPAPTAAGARAAPPLPPGSSPRMSPLRLDTSAAAPPSIDVLSDTGSFESEV